jgi:histidinol dehydrogenase
MKVIDWNQTGAGIRESVLQRPVRAAQGEVLAAVGRIVEQVRADGDSCLRALTRRFDGAELGSFEVSPEEFAQATNEITDDLKSAMREAHGRISAWHRAGMASEFELETAPGVRCGRLLRGIRRVGLYVPAGTAPLPSTALMLGVPAALAGCSEIVMCTPPRPDGRADPAVLFAARLCGIGRVFKLGGAQAIARHGLRHRVDPGLATNYLARVTPMSPPRSSWSRRCPADRRSICRPGRRKSS